MIKINLILSGLVALFGAVACYIAVGFLQVWQSRECAVDKLLPTWDPELANSFLGTCYQATHPEVLYIIFFGIALPSLVVITFLSLTFGTKQAIAHT